MSAEVSVIFLTSPTLHIPQGTLAGGREQSVRLSRAKEPGAFSSHCQENPDIHHQGTILIIYKISVVGEEEKGGNSINKGRMMCLGMM